MSNNYTTNIKLPGGCLYADSHPELAEEIELSMLTTKDEKRIFGSNSDNIMREVVKDVTNPSVDIDLLTSFDRLFLLVELRKHTYGTSYHIYSKCPECGTENEYKVDLNDMEIQSIPDNYDENFKFELPISGDEVVIKYLTYKEERAIRKRALKLSRDLHRPASELEYSFNLEKQLVSVNGEELKPVDKTEYVDNLVGRDSAYIKYKLDQNAYGYKVALPTICNSCGSEILVNFKFTSEFFHPRFD